MSEHDPTDPRALEARLAALPRELPPARDLWPGIEAALAPRAPAVRRWPLALAAGLAIGALGVLLGARLAREPPPPGPTGASGGTGPLASVMVAARLKGAENAEFLATRVALERTYHERLAMLAPATRAQIEQDLVLIQSARDDIRDALTRDPGSRVLLQLLQSTTEQEFTLYSTVGRNTEPFAPRTRT